MSRVSSGLRRFVGSPGFRLRSGEPFHPQGFLAFETFGELNPDRSNAILWPTCYAQRSESLHKKIGDGKRFDPAKYFIVAVNMLGNGVSYSPTTEVIGRDYPKTPVTYYDNAVLQEELMRSLGIYKWALIYGYSMGAMLALQWAVQFPSKVASVVAVCGSARCHPANTYLLQRLQQCLASDPHCERDDLGRVIGFSEKPIEGLRNFALTDGDWLFDSPSATSNASPDASRPEYARSKPGGCFFTEGLYKEIIPSESEEAFLEAWVNMFSKNWDAMEYYVVASTWLAADPAVGAECEGDFGRALSKIEALVYLLPGSRDQFFKVEEIEDESRYIRRCVFQPLVSPFGHLAEGRPECQAQIQDAIEACLQETAKTARTS